MDYLRIIPEATFKPKAHFLTHYPSQILEAGSNLNHSTIRFEAKHNIFKDIYHRSNNTVNITKYLAMRHQYWIYLTYKKPNILQHEILKLISGDEIPVSMLEKTIREELKSNICSEIKVIHQANEVIYEGQTYSNSSAVVIGYERDGFKFGKVEGVV